jgi:uncharacterized membrane protein
MSTRYEAAGTLRDRSPQMDYSMAKALGWFSVGLGLVETLAPSAVANLIGVRDRSQNRTLLRSPLYGPRELAAGVGLLTQAKPAGWLWARVAGDVLDITTLSSALKSRRNDRTRVAAALIAVLGVTAVDYLCAQELTQAANGAEAGKAGGSPVVRKSIWVNKPVSETYSFWRKFENLPRFMQHLESVKELGDRRSRWRARGPLGRTFEWEAVIEQEDPNRLISWRSVEDSEIENSGTVRFERGPGERGAIVHVELRYNPPGGTLGTTIAKLFGKDGDRMLEDELRAFKQILETGEIIYSDASIHSGKHPAQPPRQGRLLAESLQS